MLAIEKNTSRYIAMQVMHIEIYAKILEYLTRNSQDILKFLKGKFNI